MAASAARMTRSTSPSIAPPAPSAAASKRGPGRRTPAFRAPTGSILLARRAVSNTLRIMANYDAKGRPKLVKENKVGEIIQFQMTAQERKRCEGAAKKAGGKLSEWI